ncbi:MYXO-CTERM sorting domain-containing protein [Paraliomyxa miuraensis]|uniref:MYXO-CTERM sorting domain-containing protein n=1 Tax=Paraliomyxa miuraensis TaxID=376150 RepID=UPI00225B252F|nr:MYXO-CTERM sorting domain-containing protein [Paraliomyxa miuraensis]MCX4241233.1 MYXO-CTERM sorting domain-containing protein [Paraliomyxa miuraensis]
MRSTTLLATATALCTAGLVGDRAEAATGGPDVFGYTYFDQADGAIYTYVDITSSGIEFRSFADDILAPLTLAAPFYFYGLEFTDLDVSTNGFITRSAATASDLGNACPLPDLSDAINPRIEFVHDDLETRIFYQFFDEVQAAAVGYPGLTHGMSVIQWTGDHFPDSLPDDVNLEVILFHGSNQILMMVAADPEGGSGSTTGLYDPVTGSALTYTCDTGGSLVPGVTAVRWIAPCGDGLLDVGEDCDTAGESATCDADCSAVACGDGLTNAAAGEDCDDGGESATCNVDCTSAVCGDGMVNMAAGEICDDGGESAACNADCTPAMCGDGVVNIAAGEACDDGGESATCNADCTAVSCGDGMINMAAGEECDDGGESATCDDDCTAASCGDLTVNATAGETCDEGMRTPTCNADCTAVSCGDGMVNMAAGEECDGDGMGVPGETATCDEDCTNVMCGDGVANATAGEVCDDAGESETCNADCTTASCGDGVVNAAAGEDCDDSGESEACDDDCTSATCGDGVLNSTAGEECDDGNTDDDDDCSADCTIKEEPGSTGGADSTGGDDSTGGADSTGGGPQPPTTLGTAGSVGTTSDGSDESSTDAPITGDDGGCACTTGQSQPRGMIWSLLALIGLSGLRRRRPDEA